MKINTRIVYISNTISETESYYAVNLILKIDCYSNNYLNRHERDINIEKLKTISIRYQFYIKDTLRVSITT